MPDFPFHFRVVDFLTDQGQVVRAKRGFVLCEFAALPLVCDAFFDSAAPFSVAPFSFGQRLPWHRLATSLARAGSVVPSALLWQGIPCELGIVDIRFVHSSTGVRSGPVHLLAKFPLRRAPSQLERAVVLGLCLLDDNDVHLEMGQKAGALAGSLSVP